MSFAKAVKDSSIVFTPCEFVTRTEKCVECGNDVKKGFLVGNAMFVCSISCAEKVSSQ